MYVTPNYKEPVLLCLYLNYLVLLYSQQQLRKVAIISWFEKIYVAI